MHNDFHFDKQTLDCVVGGVSALDVPRLNIQTPDQARQFVSAYGFDLDDEAQREQLWASHRRAIALIQDQLLESGETIPDELQDPAKLQDLSRLLILASYRGEDTAGSVEDSQARELQRWSCAILRVMHVYVHLRNDLFNAFSDEIQNQILKPIQDVISDDMVAGAVFLGRSADFEGIRLQKFEVKPFKTTASSVIKLLARPERVALTLLDKLGVRLVTRSVYDSFRTIRYLIGQNIISFPHIMPDQSNNTLYPLNVFLETMAEIGAEIEAEIEAEIQAGRQGQAPDGETGSWDSNRIDERLKVRLKEARDRAEYLEKFNEFSGSEYRFIKFINRKLITIAVGENESRQKFRFFYPYEIQIMDYETYVNNLSGPMAHDEYKARQRRRARERVFGLTNASSASSAARSESAEAVSIASKGDLS